MSSVHSTKDTEDSKIIPGTTSINTSNVKSGFQGPTNAQISPKPPLRPNAPSSFPSPISSIPSGTPKTSIGDRSITPSSRQLCVLDSPGLRTPPQGFPSPYLQTPPSNTAPLSQHESRIDYFQGQRPHSSSQPRRGAAQVYAVPGTASPLLVADEYPVSHSSSKGSHTASGEYLCTTDSWPSLPGGIKAPYKARRPSSDSLTMVNQSSRRKTEESKHQRKRRCKGTCKQGRDRMDVAERNDSRHWLPPSQVVPTLRDDRPVPNTRKGNRLLTRQGRKRLMSEPATPVVSRRWSSVEIGTRQLKLPPLLKQNFGKQMQRQIPTFQAEFFTSSPLRERNRRSSFTAGAGYNDVVRSLRERLTIRKLPNNQMLRPFAITLRRPSVSNRSDRSSIMATSGFLSTPWGSSNGPSLSSHQLTFSETLPQDTEAYIITREDVEAVMELIQANILDSRQVYTPASIAPRGSTAESQSPRGTRLPSVSFTPKGMVPVVRPTPCKIQICTAHSDNSPEASQKAISLISNASAAPNRSPAYIVSHRDQGKLLEISQTDLAPHSPRSDAGTERSVHEVIWEEHHSPGSYIMDKDNLQSEDDNSQCSSRGSTPSPTTSLTLKRGDAKPCFQLLKTSNQDHRPSKEKGAFDPTNSRMSIKKWSWQCESEANEANNDLGSLVTITEQEPPKDHVISFPPLPRKTTNEWRSPLPDLTIPIRDPKLLGGMLLQASQIRHSHSLYSIGIDARTAPSSPTLSGIATTPIMRSSWLDETAAISPPERVSSWLSNFETETPKRQKSDTDLQCRKRSVIKAHPKAPARSGTAAAIGSSIGSCTGVRRRASSQALVKSNKIVIFETPLLASHHFQGGKSWFKSIQNTALARFNTTENEVEEAGFWSTLATRNSSKAPVERSTPSPPASPHCNMKDNKANSHLIQPLISPSISETLSPQRSSARQSLSMIQDKYSTVPKCDWKLNIPKRKVSSPRRSTAHQSLLKIQEKYPPLPKPDHIGIYDLITGSHRRDKVECTRDCQQLRHNCDSCASNMSSPSVDWIG